ncbi:MAG TPA: hypothetical protein VIK60_11685 [Vicinamibacterales bacterium]
MVNPLPWKIIQAPGVMLILFEQWANWRQIFTDGRPLPDVSKPSWFGYSIGRWDGDTFVAETSASTTGRGSVTMGIHTQKRCA